jgi:hypothetical protein
MQASSCSNEREYSSSIKKREMPNCRASVIVPSVLIGDRIRWDYKDRVFLMKWGIYYLQRSITLRVRRFGSVGHVSKREIGYTSIYFQTNQ